MTTMPRPREFSVWAPRATRSVDLVLDGRRRPMERGDRGYWRVTAAAAPGARYAYRVDGGDPVPDPRALRLPDGPHGAAAVYDPDAFAWTDAGWEGVELAGSVIYELHVGTFTPAGTFDGVIERLDHLVDLGIDIVELMPVASFPGTYGWGYDGVAPYAVHEPYGGPAGFQRLVDACHARGLAVCLDVVYNHLGPDGNYLGVFGPYFAGARQTPWGHGLNLDGPGSDEVRAYVLRNAAHWLRDYHVDALRLDAVHELHDDRALPILEELAIEVAGLAEELGRSLLLIAESDRNDPRTVTPRGSGGLGLAGQWADDVHHGLHVALTGETQGYYADFAGASVLPGLLTMPFFHARTYSTFRGRTHGRPVDPRHVSGASFVVALQTHDQVGNRRAGDRISADLPTRRLCCGVALLLTGPYTPMLFMGEEWAASTPWQYFTDHLDACLAEAVRRGRREEFAAHGWHHDDVPDPQDPATVRASTLDWSERTVGAHKRVLEWYRALLALRRARPDLRDPDLAAVRVHRGAVDGVFCVERGRHRVAVNLSHVPVEIDLQARDAVILLSLDPTVAVRGGTVELAPDSVVLAGPAALA